MRAPHTRKVTLAHSAEIACHITFLRYSIDRLRYYTSLAQNAQHAQSTRNEVRMHLLDGIETHHIVFERKKPQID